ncbi:MAG: type II and III secretion system protein, partial [Deltaproteobacteria bacterium]|nr:type II and III secretion system protein [Deltaproteobacteria bacterium]
VLLRELTTVARIKSGQLLIIGGLIDEVKGSEDNKVPLLGDVPLLGNAFKNSRDYTNKKELVILLRPQIVGI